MICIDFQGGAHGNFLEFACNLMANVTADAQPFNTLGAAHRKNYTGTPLFRADHYSFMHRPLLSQSVIAIKITQDDVLPLSQVSLLRAGDYNYNNDSLEVDTYHKLNNVHYKWTLDLLIESFFKNQIQDSYDRVKDVSWPAVETLQQFQQLPAAIQKECLEVHKLQLLELSATQPHCPRSVLREFFQIGFEQPDLQGFLSRQRTMMIYDPSVRCFDFPFSAFYNTEEFVRQLKMIAQWSNIDYNNQTQLLELHREFLTKQPYKDSKVRCDKIVADLIENNIPPPKISMMEEAYVNAMLRKNGYECRY